MRPRDDGSLIMDGGNNPPKKLLDLVDYLKKRNYKLELSTTAKTLLRSRLEYLKDYKRALEVGGNIDTHIDVAHELSSNFKRGLKKFQNGSVKHLIELPYAANFSVPGSGKTTIVLAAFSALRDQGIVKTLFVICPRSAFDPWEEEYEACFGARPIVARISGPMEDRSYLFKHSTEFNLFLCTYQMLANEKDNAIKVLQESSCMLVVDESHHVKKGSGGVWFDAVEEIAIFAKRRVILTGTPAPNDINDLVAQFNVLWPGLNIVENVLSTRSDARIEDIRNSIRPLYTRIKKADLDLPERKVYRCPVPMKPVQKKIYSVLTHQFFTQIIKDPEERALIKDLRKAIMIRLLQTASNPSLLNEKSVEFKMPPLPYMGVDLNDLIKEYAKYEYPPKMEVAINLGAQIVNQRRKVVIWTSFIQNTEIIRRGFERQDIDSVVVTGQSQADEFGEEAREKSIRQFKTDQKTMVLVATTPSISESISLHHVCTDAIYVDRTFNCGTYMQSLDRIHRIGLPPGSDVRYHMLICEHSIDEVIDERLDEKMELMYQLLNDDIGILNIDIPEDATEDWTTGDYDALVHQILRNQKKEKM
jgi:SNF2 family DNA or RNA helicase